MTLDSSIAMLLQGLAPLRSPRTWAAPFILSIPVLLGEAAVLWVTGFPIDIQDVHDGPARMAVTMVLVTSITSIDGSLQAAPVGLGLFETIARETLDFGSPGPVSRPVAASLSLVIHAVILLPKVTLGQVFLWAGHVSLKRQSRGSVQSMKRPLPGDHRQAGC